MSRAKLARSLARATTEAGETAAHCATTITARLPILAGWFWSPSGHALAEWNRAYAEKVAATLEGAAAASAEWQAAMIRAAFRPPSPAGLADDFARAMRKAGQPARRRVKANAKRLTTKTK